MTTTKKALSDHLADAHGMWLTRREFAAMTEDDLRSLHESRDCQWTPAGAAGASTSATSDHAKEVL